MSSLAAFILQQWVYVLLFVLRVGVTVLARRVLVLAARAAVSPARHTAHHTQQFRTIGCSLTASKYTAEAWETLILALALAVLDRQAVFLSHSSIQYTIHYTLYEL